MCTNDYQVENLSFPLLYRNGQTIASVELERLLEERFEQLESESPDEPPCWLLGHPTFSQEDIRHGGGQQMEALVSFSSSGDVFMFGDVGSATLLLAPEELRDLDFSNLSYCWASC